VSRRAIAPGNGSDRLRDHQSLPLSKWRLGLSYTKSMQQQAVGCGENLSDMDWYAIAALVPGRRRLPCRSRCRDALGPRSVGTTGYISMWTTEGNIKLKDVVQTNADKHRNAIAALVPGRTKTQCM
jgi:hypothetical protein